MKTLEQLIDQYHTFRKDLTAFSISGDLVDGIIFFNEDKLTLEQFIDIVNYLLSNGGRWQQDKEHYATMLHPGTFHLWLENENVRLHCGFVYHNSNNNKTQYALDKMNKK